MSDQMLSQEEIDALLRGEPVASEKEELEVEETLSPIEQDTLGEIGNISFGSAATALSTLLNQKVSITTPTVSIVKREELVNEFPKPHVSILVQYTEGFEGSNLLVIKTSDAQIIADLMLGGNGENPNGEFNDLHMSAVQEAMNQMMGSASTSMSTVFDKRIDISPPSIDLLDLVKGSGTANIPNDELLVKIAFNLKVGNLIDSNIMQLIPIDFSKQLVYELMNTNDSVDKGSTQAESPVPESQIETKQVEERTYEEKNIQHSQVEHFVSDTQQKKEAVANVQPVAFSEFDTGQESNHDIRNLDMLMDIPLQVTVELGRTKRKIKEILEMGQGSIIELDKLAGEPVDILVNKKLIAKGEVVVIDENFGVRITQIVSKQERIKQL